MFFTVVGQTAPSIFANNTSAKLNRHTPFPYSPQLRPRSTQYRRTWTRVVGMNLLSLWPQRYDAEFTHLDGARVQQLFVPSTVTQYRLLRFKGVLPDGPDRVQLVGNTFTWWFNFCRGFANTFSTTTSSGDDVLLLCCPDSDMDINILN